MAKIIQGKTLSDWVVHFARQRKNLSEITVILNSMGFRTNSRIISALRIQKRRSGIPLPRTKMKPIPRQIASRLRTKEAKVKRIILDNPDATYEEILAIAKENKILVSKGTIKTARLEMVSQGFVPEYVRQSSREPLELTEFQQKKFDEKKAIIGDFSDYAGKRLPEHLRDDFNASARIVALRAIQKYDPKKGNLDNYLGKSIRDHVMQFLSNTTRTESGVPVNRISICVRAEKIAWELIASGEKKNSAFEKGIRQALREHKVSKPNSKITTKDVQKDMLAIRAARYQMPTHLLRGEGKREEERNQPRRRLK